MKHKSLYIFFFLWSLVGTLQAMDVDTTAATTVSTMAVDEQTQSPLLCLPPELQLHMLEAIVHEAPFAPHAVRDMKVYFSTCRKQIERFKSECFIRIAAEALMHKFGISDLVVARVLGTKSAQECYLARQRPTLIDRITDPSTRTLLLQYLAGCNNPYNFLQFAAKEGVYLPRICPFLVAGADPNWCSEEKSLLATAVEEGNLRMVKDLINAGARVGRRDTSGDTPLLSCVQQWDGIRQEDLEIAEYLINAGADVNVRGQKQYTPLMYAALVKQYSLLQLLIAACAKLDLQNEHGDTALMTAAQWRYTDATSILLMAGARRDIINNDGETAQDLARKKKHNDIVALLDEDASLAHVPKRRRFMDAEGIEG